MNQSQLTRFQTFLLWYLIKLSGIILVGALFLVGALDGYLFMWLGVVLAVALGVVLANQYHTNIVLIQGSSMVIRRGIISSSEYYASIVDARYEVQQGPFGKLFDYGTLLIRVEGEIVTLKHVSCLRGLTLLIEERRQLLIALAQQRQTIAMVHNVQITSAAVPMLP